MKSIVEKRFIVVIQKNEMINLKRLFKAFPKYVLYN